MLVYIANDKKYYLTVEGKFVEDFRQIMPIHCEIVSKGNSHQPTLIRLKCFNKFYITESEKGILMQEEKSDKNIIYQTWKNIHFLNSTMCIEAEKKLSTLFDYDEKKPCSLYPQENGYLRFDNGLDTKMKQLYVNGFCVMDLNLDVCSKELFDRCKYIVHASGEKKLSVLKTDTCFQKLLFQPEIKCMMDDIYGKNNYHLTSFNSNKINKGLNSSSDDWTTGHPYNCISGNFPAKTLGIQVMILLDDFTNENGGHNVCVYSQTFRSNPTKDTIAQNNKFMHRMTAKKGSVILMLGKLWSQEGKNEQEAFKSSLIATISSLDVAPKPDLKQQFVFKDNVLNLKDERIMFADIPLPQLVVSKLVSDQKQTHLFAPMSFPTYSVPQQTESKYESKYPQSQPQQINQLHNQPRQINQFQMPSGIPNLFGTTQTQPQQQTTLFGTISSNNPFDKSFGISNGTNLFGIGNGTGNANTNNNIFGSSAISFGIPEKKESVNNNQPNNTFSGSFW